MVSNVNAFSNYSSKRNWLPFKYSATLSKAIHLRSSLSATAPLVFDPAKGSITKSPGAVSIFMKNSGNAAGKRAG